MQPTIPLSTTLDFIILYIFLAMTASVFGWIIIDSIIRISKNIKSKRKLRLS